MRLVIRMYRKCYTLPVLQLQQNRIQTWTKHKNEAFNYEHFIPFSSTHHRNANVIPMFYRHHYCKDILTMTYYFLVHQHETAGINTLKNTDNVHSSNGILFGDHAMAEWDRFSFWRAMERRWKRHIVSRIFSDNADEDPNLLSELDSQTVPRACCLHCKWVKHKNGAN